MAAAKKIPIDALKPNANLDDLLWLDEKFLLLTKESPITASLIKNLRKWGYSEVITKGTVAAAPIVPEMEQLEISSVLIVDADEEEGLQKSAAIYRELTHFTRDTYQTFHFEQYLDLVGITEKVKELIEVIRHYKSYMARLSELTTDSMEAFIETTVRTTIVAVFIGEALKLPQFRLIELGIAGVLHKIGMMKIPIQICEKIYNKAAPLTDSEKKLFTAHPALGMRLLSDYCKKAKLAIAPEIPIGIGQHQERENGSGYPLGLVGKDITQIGKILAVASVYNARVSERAHRESLNGHHAMLMVLKEIETLYDKRVVKALLSSFSLYPPGTYVCLNNGAIGIVTEINDGDLKAPIVKLLLDEHLQVFRENTIVNTHKEGSLSVGEVLSNQQIADLKAKKLLAH